MLEGIDLRLGDWRTALADVGMVDAVITDPPYGKRTHDGHDDGAEKRRGMIGREFKDVAYVSWTSCDVDFFVQTLAPKCRGWFCSMTSHDLIPSWETAYNKCGRYVFAPVPWIDRRPRLIGDGPSSWACYLMVSRPKNTEFSRWGCLDGAYLPGARESDRVIGGKPLWLMRAIIRDYTRPGDLVCDPCAGGGTTLLAAAIEGRRAVGAELDPATYAKAKRRLEAGYTPSLWKTDV